MFKSEAKINLGNKTMDGNNPPQRMMFNSCHPGGPEPMSHPSMFGGPSVVSSGEPALTGEYLKLQDDFLKWQQQLMDNQSVLHSRVAPIASQGAAMRDMQPNVQQMPRNMTGPGVQTQQSQEPRKKPREINIPIMMEGDDDEEKPKVVRSDSRPSQPTQVFNTNSGPQMTTNPNVVRLTSWQDTRPQESPADQQFMQQRAFVNPPPIVRQARDNPVQYPMPPPPQFNSQFSQPSFDQMQPQREQMQPQMQQMQPQRQPVQPQRQPIQPQRQPIQQQRQPTQPQVQPIQQQRQPMQPQMQQKQPQMQNRNFQPPICEPVFTKPSEPFYSNQNHSAYNDQGYQQPQTQAFQQPSPQPYQQPSPQPYQQPSPQPYQQPSTHGYQQPQTQAYQPVTQHAPRVSPPVNQSSKQPDFQRANSQNGQNFVQNGQSLQNSVQSPVQNPPNVPYTVPSELSSSGHRVVVPQKPVPPPTREEAEKEAFWNELHNRRNQLGIRDDEVAVDGQVQRCGPSTERDDGLNARFTSVVTLNDNSEDQPQKDKVRSIVQLNNSDENGHTPVVRGYKLHPEDPQNRRETSEERNVKQSSVAPMSSRLVQAVTAAPSSGGQRVSPPKKMNTPSPPPQFSISQWQGSNENAPPTMYSRSSPSRVSPPKTYSQSYADHGTSRVSPPKSGIPDAPSMIPSAPMPPPPPPPPGPPPPPSAQRTSTGKRIIPCKDQLGAQLDDREELMVAIRSFGGSGGSLKRRRNFIQQQ